MKVVVVPFVLCLLLVQNALAGPVFPTRGFLISPRWTGKVDTTSVFDHAGYWAGVQRGFGSDSDRWGWSISMGAVWEFARWGGNKSLIALTGMELTANTHNDISFKPRGAYWEEGLMYAVHENDKLDWQIGSIYRCRHDLDNIDPRGYSGINGQRTLIYCSLSGKLVYNWTQQKEKFGKFTIWPDVSAAHADMYLVREDYRIPDTITTQPNYQHLAWSAGENFLWHIKYWQNGSIYAALNVNISSFGNEIGFFSRFASIAKITSDSRAELGYTYEGRAGRIQFYGGYESWEDDGQVPIPRNAHYAMLGVRVTSSDLVTY